MELVEFIDDAVFGRVVGELETHLCILVDLSDVSDCFVDGVANRSSSGHSSGI
jgi:hypothetical protein